MVLQLQRMFPLGALLLAISGPTLAQSQADEQCAELMDATPGLFGLCLAICSEDGSEAPQAVVDAYNRRMGPDDPTPWCLDDSSGACPCFDTTALDALVYDSRWEQQRMVDDTLIEGTNWCATSWAHAAGVSWYADGAASCSYDGASQTITVSEAIACDQLINDYARNQANWFCSAPDGTSCDYLTAP